MTDKVAVSLSPERAREGLGRWLETSGRHWEPVEVLPSPEATGYSHTTVVFRAGSRRLVARVQPREVSVFPSPDLGREYRLLAHLVREGLPVPPLVAWEPDERYLGAPFYVMEYVPGLVPSDSPPYSMGGWLLEASPAIRERVWWSGLAAMARAHVVSATPLTFVNAGRPLGLEGELAYWGDYAAFCGGDVPPAAARAWSYLKSEAPSETQLGLCWGDARLGNQIFRNTECVALLDWEMASLSDPVQDLAWFIYFDDLFTEGLGVPRLEGIPSRSETIHRYEDLTGHTVRHFDYFEIFAAFRFVLILERLGHLQVAAGLLPPDSTFPIDNFATAYLERLLKSKGIA